MLDHGLLNAGLKSLRHTMETQLCLRSLLNFNAGIVPGKSLWAT